MSRCPNVQRCRNCDKQLVHKGSRNAHESSSLLGQIVHNLMPIVFTWADIDAALWRRSIRLLRIYEHKSPEQHRKPAQQELLQVLSQVVEHSKNCPDFQREIKFHPESGVYLIEGDPHEGNQLGPSKITAFRDGKIQIIEDELEMLCWLALLKHEDRNRVQDKLSRRRCIQSQNSTPVHKEQEEPALFNFNDPILKAIDR